MHNVRVTECVRPCAHMQEKQIQILKSTSPYDLCVGEMTKYTFESKCVCVCVELILLDFYRN